MLERCTMDVQANGLLMDMQLIDADRVSGETLTIKFVALSELAAMMSRGEALWQRNCKKHDIGALHQSIVRNGFRDCAAWDKTLNDGNGGLVYGNGRTEVLVSLLLDMKSRNEEPPRGIPIDIDSGEWCIPIKFGLDSESEAAAMSFAIDHNNLTMSGGDFDLTDMLKMWDEDIKGLLVDLAEVDMLPVTFDADSIGTLLSDMSPDAPPPEFPSYGDDIPTEHECPSCGYKFSGKVKK